MKLEITTTIKRQGNSCWILIKKPVLEAINKKEGDEITIEIKGWDRNNSWEFCGRIYHEKSYGRLERYL